MLMLIILLIKLHNNAFFQVLSMMARDFSKIGEFLYLYNLKSSVVNVFKGIKNCNIILCTNMDELEQHLIENIKH